ncbi:MAG TPA: hypothetical protein VF070_44990 [Streptosporangiaceae bacterium]
MRTPPEDVGQMADVGGARCPDDGLVEIRILMDRVDPPAGRLSIVAAADLGPGRQAEEICFTGWLGLLRALYEATGSPGGRPGQEP